MHIWHCFLLAFQPTFLFSDKTSLHCWWQSLPFLPNMQSYRENDTCRVKSQGSTSCSNTSILAGCPSNITCDHSPVGSRWGIVSFMVHLQPILSCQAASVELGQGGGRHLHLCAICFSGEAPLSDQKQLVTFIKGNPSPTPTVGVGSKKDSRKGNIPIQSKRKMKPHKLQS